MLAGVGLLLAPVVVLLLFLRGTLNNILVGAVGFNGVTRFAPKGSNRSAQGRAQRRPGIANP